LDLAARSTSGLVYVSLVKVEPLLL